LRGLGWKGQFMFESHMNFHWELSSILILPSQSWVMQKATGCLRVSTKDPKRKARMNKSGTTFHAEIWCTNLVSGSYAKICVELWFRKTKIMPKSKWQWWVCNWQKHFDPTSEPLWSVLTSPACCWAPLQKTSLSLFNIVWPWISVGQLDLSIAWPSLSDNCLRSIG